MILKDAPRCVMATAGGGIGATLAGVALGVEIKFGILGIALVAAAAATGGAVSMFGTADACAARKAKRQPRKPPGDSEGGAEQFAPRLPPTSGPRVAVAVGAAEVLVSVAVGAATDTAAPGVSVFVPGVIMLCVGGVRGYLVRRRLADAATAAAMAEPAKPELA